MASNDPLDRTDFEVVSYINSSLFPTEQSLAGLSDVISTVEDSIITIDKEIRGFVRDQTGKRGEGQDGVSTLSRAQASIEALVAKVSDMKGRAEQSEAAVRDMTRDIRQLDTAKRNLTVAITTLNHLNMLVSGADTLRTLVSKRQYGDTANLLQGVANVLEHFEGYHSIPQVFQLSRQVAEIKSQLGDQICLEFRETFSLPAPGAMNTKQMSEACLVLDVLEPHIKHDLLQWFVGVQLKEYSVLFDENEDFAWLDKIDKRYAWLKKHLIQFEERYSSIFPAHWDISQRIAVQFCHQTRQDLSKVMGRRRHDIDVKLLLTAIQKTSAFENLLFLRFGGHTLESSAMEFKSDTCSTKASEASKNPFIEVDSSWRPPGDQKLERESKCIPNTFQRLITQCYDPFLYIYIDSQDKNLVELIEKFALELKTNGFPTPKVPEANGIVLSNCADLFVFYKKCLVQCTQLSCGEPLLNLGHVFSKRLREYCSRILQANLPKLTISSAGLSSVTNITRELRDLSTSGIIQNFQSLLKEGEVIRLSRQELYKISCILTTAEYCVETTQQLEEKLKEKLAELSANLSMDGEKNLFLDVIEMCIGIFVQDLYSACEPALVSVTKTNWQIVDAVGDQSGYISSITSQWRLTIPTLRDFLTTSRKYFVIFCQQFARLFMSKFISTVYKCKNVSKSGAQQLLLDAQSLKTGLLDLPSIGLTVKRKPPDKYSKLIAREMGRTEMILKIVMAPVDEPRQFVDHTCKLIPDCDLTEFGKILDMKGYKKIEQTSLMDEFKQRTPAIAECLAPDTASPETSIESSRIRKLEKLIKKRL